MYLRSYEVDHSPHILFFPHFAIKVIVKGIMRAKFSPSSNKLISAELLFDASNVAAQFLNTKTRVSPVDNCDEVAAAAAAQAAAHEADALLDSIQMPALNAVPAAITVSAAGAKEAQCVTCSESSDESTTDGPPSSPHVGVVARRSTRQKV